jgi:hypothetical protein
MSEQQFQLAFGSAPSSSPAVVLTSPKREAVHLALVQAGASNKVARAIARDFDAGWLGRCCGVFDGVTVTAGRGTGNRRKIRIAADGS